MPDEPGCSRLTRPTITDRYWSTLQIASHSDPLCHIVGHFWRICTSRKNYHGNRRLLHKLPYWLAHPNNRLGLQRGLPPSDCRRQQHDHRRTHVETRQLGEARQAEV